MSKERIKTIEIREGMIKGGGVKPKPTQPKPENISPPPQKKK
jgi:hypothetical protein